MNAVLADIEPLDDYVDRRRDQIRRDLGRDGRVVLGSLSEAMDDRVTADRLLLAFRVGSDAQLGKLVRRTMQEALMDRAEAIAEAEYRARSAGLGETQ